MKTQHTPGPWRLDGKVIKSNNGQNIGGCVVSRMTGPDARLIAAAPEMFEALQQLKRRVESFLPPIDCSKELAAARAALEKAGAQ